MTCRIQAVAGQRECETCHGSHIEFVYGGHGNILELPCSMCEPLQPLESSPMDTNYEEFRDHITREISKVVS